MPLFPVTGFFFALATERHRIIWKLKQQDFFGNSQSTYCLQIFNWRKISQYCLNIGTDCLFSWFNILIFNILYRKIYESNLTLSTEMLKSIIYLRLPTPTWHGLSSKQILIVQQAKTKWDHIIELKTYSGSSKD